jgi:N-acetylneuraminate synthase/sialic acid synthase
LIIDGKQINDSSDCWVIAEVGHNHQGDVEKCKRLFDAAKEAGADAVKLQKRDNRALFTKDLYDKPYENENSFGRTYGEHREALEFGVKEYRELQAYCHHIGITFFATAFDIPSADFLAALEVPAIKIASGDLKNIPLLKHVAGIGKPMIISTGGGSMEDVQRAYDAIMPINKQLAILQCTASYPTPAEEMNLRTISTFRAQLPGITVGLSDHYNGIAMTVAAYVLGARIIEKHFTLNHTWKGTDHAMSLEPEGMRKMVRDLRRARAALGDGVKQTLPSEKNALHKMGKKLVAAHDLPAGHVLTMKDVAIKSPGDGLPPYEIERLIGRKLARALREDENLRIEDVT